MRSCRTFNRILTLEDLPLLREQYRSKHITCATGSYDVIHSGHVKFLERASGRVIPTILVVGVLTDEAQLALKRREPHVPGDDRLYVISRLGCVDHAVFFGEEEELILALRPDMVVISPTSPSERIRQKEMLAARIGAETYVIEEQSPIHSSELIARMKRKSA